MDSSEKFVTHGLFSAVSSERQGRVPALGDAQGAWNPVLLMSKMLKVLVEERKLASIQAPGYDPPCLKEPAEAKVGCSWGTDWTFSCQ